MKGERCETCRFYWLSSDFDRFAVNLCRRHAPTETGWPKIRVDFWCGEYEPKDAEEIRTRAHLCCTHDFEMAEASDHALCTKCGFTTTMQTLVESGYLDYVEQAKKADSAPDVFDSYFAKRKKGEGL